MKHQFFAVSKPFTALGGAQFLFCDGSVHFISENIDSRLGDLNDPATFGTYNYYPTDLMAKSSENFDDKP